MEERKEMPFLSFDEQVTRLKDQYKLNISNRDFALHALSSMSYYDLINGYKECFMDDDTYKNNVSIEYLYTFYHFDRSLQNVLFQYSVYVENFFKTALSYVLAEDFGVYQDEYLKRSNFVNPKKSNRRNKLTRTLENIHNTYKKDKYVDQPTKHYLYTKAHIPPWILFKNVTFSNAIDLYSFLKLDQKDKVIKILSPKLLEVERSQQGNSSGGIVKNSLTVVRKYRNAIAHNLKFITSRSGVEYVPLLRNIPEMAPFVEGDTIRNDSPYSMILAMTLLLNDDYLIHEMFDGISLTVEKFIQEPNQAYLFQEYSQITGIPEDIIQRYNAYLNQ